LKKPFYQLLLHYAPKDMLQAKRIVPRKLLEGSRVAGILSAKRYSAVDIDISVGDPGMEANHAIEIDDSDEEAVS
jgi:hypothetical protein